AAVAIPGPERLPRIARVRSAQAVARGAYGISGQSTRLELVTLGDKPEKVSVILGAEATLASLRHTTYYLQSEPGTLADDVLDTDIGGKEIELQTRIEGLQVGQWVIVAGERTDIRDSNDDPVTGVRGGELAMIADVSHKTASKAPGDTLHTILTLPK